MRILFNHGLTPGELYTNTPKTITDRSWRWWIRNYGSTNSYEDSLSKPFKYCIGLILNKILEDKIRFKIPVNSEAYIDFEIVKDDKFIEQRQNGRFSEIDFIESDFTGYFLNYYFQAKAYQKAIPIYLGGDLKRKFLSKINTGEKFYTVKDFTLNDVFDTVHSRFVDIPKGELKVLLLHGFRRMHSAIKFGCAITIAAQKNINCYAYIGKLTLTPDKQIREYSIRRDRKLRKIAGWRKEPFDGYYYIGLNPTAFDRWVLENKNTICLVNFTNIIPRKLQEELYYKAKHLHVFRFKRKTFKGWAYWAPKLKVRGLEYLGESYEHKFTPSYKTWKQLIKEYEAREC